MLHRCIEGEKVGVDGSKIVDLDRRPNRCPGGIPAPSGERGREPPLSSSSLSSSLDGRRVPPLVHGGHGGGGVGAPPRLDLSLCFPLFHVPFLCPSPFLKFPEIHNSECVEIFTRFFP